MKQFLIENIKNAAATNTIGIYGIYCLANDKIYIGQSKNICRRWCGHRFQLRKGIHSNPHLQAAWSKYAEAVFSFYILDICSVGQLTEREGEILSKLHVDQVFNHKAVSDAFECRDETKQKISKLHKGKTLTEEHKKKLSIAHKGKVTWNKNKTGVQVAWNKGLKGSIPWNKGLKKSNKDTNRISKANSTIAP